MANLNLSILKFVKFAKLTQGVVYHMNTIYQSRPFDATPEAQARNKASKPSGAFGSLPLQARAACQHRGVDFHGLVQVYVERSLRLQLGIRLVFHFRYRKV